MCCHYIKSKAFADAESVFAAYGRDEPRTYSDNIKFGGTLAVPAPGRLLCQQVWRNRIAPHLGQGASKPRKRWNWNDQHLSVYHQNWHVPRGHHQSNVIANYRTGSLTANYGQKNHNLFFARLEWVLPLLEPEYVADQIMEALLLNRAEIFLPRALYFLVALAT